MSTPLIGMELKEACDLVTDYADLPTGGDFLEALGDMTASYDELDRDDRVALNMVLRAGRRMFAPVED